MVIPNAVQYQVDPVIPVLPPLPLPIPAEAQPDVNPNPAHIDEIFLKLGEVRNELNEQCVRIEHKYEMIGVCCGVVVAIAAIITVWALGLTMLSAIPMIANAAGKMISSNPDLHSVLILLIVFGTLMGTPLLGFGTYGLFLLIQTEIVKSLRNSINNMETNGIDTRLSEKDIRLFFDTFDEEGQITLIKKMDFKQLHATEKLLGPKKFQKILSHISGAGNLRQHDAWNAILLLGENSDAISLTAKLKEMDAKYSMHYPQLKLMITEHLYHQKALGTSIFCAKLWSQNPEPILHPVQHEVKEEGERKFRGDDQGLTVNPKQVNNILPPNAKITLKLHQIGEKDYSEEMNVSHSMLLTYSNFFTQKLKGINLEEDKKEYSNELALDVKDIEAFKKTIDLLNTDDLNPDLSDNMLMRIIICSQTYFSEFSNNLLSIISDKELISRLKRPMGDIPLLKERFNKIKIKSSQFLTVTEFEELEREPENDLIIQVLKLKKESYKTQVLKANLDV